MSASLFVSTVRIVTESQFDGMKPGQWVMFDSGVRGQYLGTTRAGVRAIRYQKDGKFTKVDARANKPLRAYAKIYGSK